MILAKPSFRLIKRGVNTSFISSFGGLDDSSRWHYHPELELVNIIEGKTTALVGDTFKEFETGDLILIGSNVPHVFQENADHKRSNAGSPPHMQVVQFTQSFLGEDFFSTPEFRHIGIMLKNANRGISFSKNTAKRFSSDFTKLNTRSGTKNILTFLSILCRLAESRNYKYIANHNYHFDHNQDEERMRKVNEYIYRCFQDKITIAQVATVANMTENAFCRYFKSRTLRPFTRFLNEVRIAFACKLLQNSDYNVSDACFNSGFNSLSYFNRQFKTIMRLSPKSFKAAKEKISPAVIS